MARFTFTLYEFDGEKRDELDGEYVDVAHAIREAKRFLFDVSHEILARSPRGVIRIEVRNREGEMVFEASLEYAAR